MTAKQEDKRNTRIYGAAGSEPKDVPPAIPAATVALLRDSSAGVEILMLHRTSKVHFGGMWVFPGGRIDPADYPQSTDPESTDPDGAARNAAARETREETGLIVRPEHFVCFAHWMPPPTTPRRYSTLFFATRVDDQGAVEVDGEEIEGYQWIEPQAMLERHRKGEVDLAPPTWITLDRMAHYSPVGALLSALESQPRQSYQTRLAVRTDGVRVAMWAGDAGYASGHVDASGPRRRLVMENHRFRFENTIEQF